VLVADKGYGSQIIRDKGFDWPLYKLRHLVENAFVRLKQYRAVATRYDKLTRNYESIVSLACALLWPPM